jgi:hypothetical protein
MPLTLAPAGGGNSIAKGEGTEQGEKERRQRPEWSSLLTWGMSRWYSS